MKQHTLSLIDDLMMAAGYAFFCVLFGSVIAYAVYQLILALGRP